MLRFAGEKTLPVLFGYLFLGIAFGVLLQQAGYGVGWALAISSCVYAGSIQFVMVGFLSGGAGFASIALMTLLINSRHLFYGLSFIEKFRRMGKLRPYLIFSLTDETYSLLCSLKMPPELDEREVFFTISLLDQLYWVAGSVLGSVLGSLIPFDTTGIDFAMTALFVVIFVEQWLEAKSRLPAVIGLVSSVLCLLLVGPEHFILPALLVTVTVLLLCKNRLQPVFAEPAPDEPADGGEVLP